MGNSSLQCLLSIVLLYFNLPMFPCTYDIQLCIGDHVTGMKMSIGQGSEEYHKHALSKTTAVNQGCFDGAETDKNTWIPNYIVYKSTDVKDNSDEGNTLLGWLSVQVNVRDGLDTFVVQSFVPINVTHFVPGEIVTTRFATGCKENLGGQGFPKKHLAPCYYAADTATSLSNAVAWVGKDLKEFRFTFRTDFPECAMINDKETLEFRFFGNRQRTVAGICNQRAPIFTAPLNKLGVQNFTYGGYDPDPPRASSSVTCNTHVNSSRRWVTEYYRNALLTNGNDRNNPVLTETLCFKNIRDLRVTNKSFYGRCRIDYPATPWAWVTHEKEYTCSPKAYRRHGPEYVDYIPENPAGKGGCAGCQAARNRTRSLGMACASEIGKNIWGSRTTHGIAMVWTAMAIIPLATLISRYYKETFMRHRYVNVHVWHGVHAAAACTGFAGLLSGWFAALLGRLYFGFSKNKVGYLHWISGYLSILAFLVAFFGSSVRIFDRGMRLFTIFFHFLAGSVTRICWSVCLLSSIFVPGSPVALKDVHISGFTLEPAIAVIIPWIIVDVAVHLFLMFHLKSMDKNSRFPTVRTYAIAVPIPLISPDEETDFPGAFLKTILLVVHTVVGTLCALILSVFMCLSKPTNRFFGHMWYTHKDSGKLNMLMNDTLYS